MTPHKLATVTTVALLAAAYLAAQEKPVSRPAEASRLRQWIDEVQGTDPRGTAFARLLGSGAPAAKAIANAIDPKNPQRTGKLLLLLEEMGPSATVGLDTLWGKAEQSEGEPQRQILDCILTLASHLGPSSASQLQRAQRILRPMMLEEKDKRQKLRNAETDSRARQLSSIADLGLEQLLEAARDTAAHRSFGSEMAMILLSHSSERTAEETRRGIEVAAAQLEKPANRGLVKLSASWGQINFPCGPETNRRYAVALLRMKPEPAQALAAHVCLLGQGLPHEQWRALREVRKHPAAADKFEWLLRALASTAGTERALRYEVVTTLAILPRITNKTRKLLQSLSSSKDPALAARAKAALRNSKPR